MKIGYVFGFVLGFVLGFGIFLLDGGMFTGFVVSDIGSPTDRVAEEDIFVFEDRVVLMIENATLSSYSGSGSMKPFFDKGANGVRVVPASVDDVDVGDIVSYRIGDKLIVHRVVEKGLDEKGIYFVVQGDDNLISDGKVRFGQIEWVTVAVVF